MGLGLSIVATLPWLYCHDALFPLERLNASKDIFDWNSNTSLVA